MISKLITKIVVNNVYRAASSISFCPVINGAQYNKNHKYSAVVYDRILITMYFILIFKQ